MKFQKELDTGLNNMNVSRCIDCKDVHGTNTQHIEEIDMYTNVVLNTIVSSIEKIASAKS